MVPRAAPARSERYRRRGEWFRRALVPWFYFDLVGYGLLVAAGAALGAHDQRRRLELRELGLASELARAQLEALRYQIQPHFLFNTLHGVAALIRRQDNQQALAMLLELAALLRATLERPAASEPSLGEELELVRRYVALQQMRFGDRLRVAFAVADECLEQAVPWPGSRARSARSPPSWPSR